MDLKLNLRLLPHIHFIQLILLFFYWYYEMMNIAPDSVLGLRNV